MQSERARLDAASQGRDTLAMVDPRARIAFQGVPGAFSHEACLAHAPDFNPTPCSTFEAVFASVADAACARAMVPVENSTAGPVPEVAALLPASGLRIVCEYDWPVRLQLMATSGVRVEDILEVASHPMALKQCMKLLAKQSWRPIPVFDTAGAAAALAERPDPVRAVVASRAASDLYGLPILMADVQDTSDNVTRFLMLARP